MNIIRLLLSRSYDSCLNEFLQLGSHGGVTEVLVSALRVLLHLLKSHLNHRILDDGLYLRIGHGFLLSFFIRKASVFLSDFHVCLLKSFLGFGVLWILFENFLVCLDCLVILFADLETLSLFQQCL